MLELLVEANDRGAVDRERAEAFAKQWLAISGGELACSVLEGGPFGAARLDELCELVLRLTSDSGVTFAPGKT
ncbi:MAG TPA: hypothetical protein VF881_16945 [Polyangiaceae bacterium]